MVCTCLDGGTHIRISRRSEGGKSSIESDLILDTSLGEEKIGLEKFLIGHLELQEGRQGGAIHSILSEFNSSITPRWPRRSCNRKRRCA